MLTYFICMTSINFTGKKCKRMDNEELILKLDEEAEKRANEQDKQYQLAE